MSSKSPTEIIGLEFDWLATDAEGHVAVFSTAGGGYAPPGFLMDTDLHDEAITAMLATPAIAGAIQVGDTGACPFWLDLAARGLYAYDSDFFGRPYRLVAAPTVAVALDDLPQAIRLAFETVRLPGLKFRECATLDVAQLG